MIVTCLVYCSFPMWYFIKEGLKDLYDFKISHLMWIVISNQITGDLKLCNAIGWAHQKSTGDLKCELILL